MDKSSFLSCKRCENNIIFINKLINSNETNNDNFLIDLFCTQCGRYSIKVKDFISLHSLNCNLNKVKIYSIIQENEKYCSSLIQQIENMIILLNDLKNNTQEKRNQFNIKINQLIVLDNALPKNQCGKWMLRYFDNFNSKIQSYLSTDISKYIENDFAKIKSKIAFISNEISFLLKSSFPFEFTLVPNKVIPSSLYSIIVKPPNHFEIKQAIDTKMLITSILSLSNGNIAVGSEEKMIIFDIKINKKVIAFTGYFKKIFELNHYPNGNNNIVILSLEQRKFKIYNAESGKMIKSFNQYDEIETICELSNGNILFSCNESIYQTNLSISFCIKLNGFCYSIIELKNKNIAYCDDHQINVINIQAPSKILHKLIGEQRSFIQSMKEVDNGYILSSQGNSVFLWNVEQEECIFTYYNSSFYAKEIITKGEMWYFLGNKEIEVWEKDCRQILYQINNLKPYYSIQIKITTPFDIVSFGTKNILLCVYENTPTILNLVY